MEIIKLVKELWAMCGLYTGGWNDVIGGNMVHCLHCTIKNKHPFIVK